MNKSAVSSFVLSLIWPCLIVGTNYSHIQNLYWLFYVAIAFPLAAISLGHIARRQVRKIDSTSIADSRLATTGLTLGYLEIIVLGAILFANLALVDRYEHSEASAVGSLHALNIATNAFADAHRSEGYPRSISELAWDGLGPEQTWQIDKALASGVKSRYRLTYVPRSLNGIIVEYQIYADPEGPQKHDDRHFFTDQTEVIRWAIGTRANESSPAL